MRARTFLVAVAAVTVLSLFPASAAFANTAPTCTGDHFVAVSGVVQFPGGACTDADNDSIEYSVVDWPTGGSLVGSPQTGQATYTAFAGTTEDSFTFRAFDGQVFSDPAEMTIEVAPGTNLAPACPVSHLFVAPGGSVDAVGNCVDPEGNSIVYGLQTFPTGGTLQILTGSSVRYFPNAGTLSDSFVFTATDQLHPPLHVTVGITVTAGNVFATAPEATPGTPFVASVESPAGGPVSIDTRGVSSPPPMGFLLLGQEFDIEAPPASVENPLKLVFKVDASAVPGGQVEVFRDMATNPTPIPDCDPDAGGHASPDPCVLSRVGTAPDDVEVTVLSSHASQWNLAVSPYAFTGFSAPVNNDALNEMTAGRAVPLRFSLGGDHGLDILAPGYPRSQAVDCAATATVDGIETTVTPGSSTLSYDAGSDRYTYVWKTDKSWSGCRQLVVKLSDGSKHRATFKFR